MTFASDMDIDYVLLYLTIDPTSLLYSIIPWNIFHFLFDKNHLI